ncbi:MAG TPA: M23 family metallopeptidase [Polyangiaceae bacterium]|nr:M23 family metallopeptidase [Polyangiaceae bacterium]
MRAARIGAWCLSCAVVACASGSNDARSAASAAGDVPVVASASPPPAPTAPGPPEWSYVLPLDHGIRTDAAGEGGFRARRSHGEHNGLDLLAPLGTPVLAACAGEARSGSTGAFGNWVQLVCPLPEAFGGSAAGYASLFYAHLLDAEVGDFVSVPRGRPLGRVGKTGNAAGPTVQPHLHLELVIADDARAARDESHSGLLQSSNWAVAVFLSRLSRACLSPYAFASSSGQLQRARRVDPFMVLTCFAIDKPALVTPAPPLAAASVPWKERYSAQGFEVNQGLPSFALAEAPVRVTAEYLVGRWQGEYLGTQAFASLEVSASGRFTLAVQTGPETRCNLQGRLGVEGPKLHFETEGSECAGAESHFAWTYVLDASADRFSVADAELPDAVSREGSELRGPVWTFSRQRVSADP